MAHRRLGAQSVGSETRPTPCAGLRPVATSRVGSAVGGRKRRRRLRQHRDARGSRGERAHVGVGVDPRAARDRCEYSGIFRPCIEGCPRSGAPATPAACSSASQPRWRAADGRLRRSGIAGPTADAGIPRRHRVRGWSARRCAVASSVAGSRCRVNGPATGSYDPRVRRVLAQSASVSMRGHSEVWRSVAAHRRSSRRPGTGRAPARAQPRSRRSTRCAQAVAVVEKGEPALQGRAASRKPLRCDGDSREKRSSAARVSRIAAAEVREFGNADDGEAAKFAVRRQILSNGQAVGAPVSASWIGRVPVSSAKRSRLVSNRMRESPTMTIWPDRRHPGAVVRPRPRHCR